MMVPPCKVNLLAGCTGVAGSPGWPINNSLASDAPRITTAALMVADMRMLHIVI